ncbi:MAG: hypothetical protein ACP5RH_23000, partial [Leptodesmis sp.]|uniref:hypothetical protein n=1 Tax=Leptodesmis sp. TaxID=3100501 RepID=UPI003D0A273A
MAKTHQEFLIDNWQHYSRRDDAKLAFGGLILGGIATALTSNIFVGAAVIAAGYGLAFKQICDDGKRLRIMGLTGAVA